MKKNFLILLGVLLASTMAMAQAPAIFNYQGVARNSVGNVLVNKSITLRLTIHDGTAAGPVVYQETRGTQTNPFGLFNVQVGSTGASNVTGTIAGVPWGVGAKYIQVEIDPNGGTSFINIGTAQIASVPYAWFATLAGDLVLPFNKTQSDAGTLFRITNSGNGAGSTALEGLTNSTAGNASAIIGTVTSTGPGGFSSGIRGINNGTGGLGIGVYGSQNGSGWGVYGTTPNGIGVHGNSANGFGVYGLSTNGTGVYGSSSVGAAGIFEISNNASTAVALTANSNGSGNTFGATNTGTGRAGTFTINNAASTANALQVSSNGTAAALRATSSNASPKALFTAGGVQLTGINEANNRILTSDAAGNATWQDPAASGVITGSGTLNFIPKWTPSGTNLGNSLLFDDGTSVGLGTTTPTHRFTVQHGGSNGLAVRSSSSFSVVDIDAASGDAALRFGKAGVNQWNLRNRPADDYFEFFELGGGGSRMVIQDGTGNVGIGETNNPTYRLDVLHGGSTGIRSRSSASFSVVDIDAASGDAALRFQKAGTGVWNTRNRPADDYYEIFELGGGGSRFVIQDGTGNVGIGETNNPTYRLDVLHGGSTGIRSRSSSSFSVVDIDAASGDAALRFAKAGVNQWNLRNRPADDYFEFFELGGGGSRMVIQDGTGNVGIGETNNPTYRLDVLHGGSTGIRSRSSASFSVVDIDAASGDAALRFQKAGTGVWNTRNRPADDYYEIFELGGGGSRFVIQNGTGNVGIGETTNPTYRLDVLHGGATGIRSKSSSTFSVIDIDGANGDAALRFARAGSNQWVIRNDPANDNLQFFENGGGGERMRIESATGNVAVIGNLSKGGGSFKIDDPLDPENKYLYHSFVESPDMMNIYNGNVTTDASGKATVQLPAYFEALNMEFRYQLTVIGSFAQAIVNKEVAGNKFEIATSTPNVKVSWQVTGIRHDAYANQNRIPNVVDKEKENKGKYLHPTAFGQPVEKGINYQGGNSPLSSLTQVAPANTKPAPPTSGGSLDQGPIVPPVMPAVDVKGTSLEQIAPAKTVAPNPANENGSTKQTEATKEAKPAVKEEKGSSVEELPKPAENKKAATETRSTN